MSKTSDMRYWNMSKDQRKNRTLLYTYGLSLADYKDKIKKQNGCCKICNKTLIKPRVDHDHKTGYIRGILCQSCNSGIGLFQDNTEVLKKAIKYLESYQYED